MDDKNSFIPKLLILLIGIGSAALVVTVYHCIAVGWCSWRLQRFSSPRRPRQFSVQDRRSGQGQGHPSFESMVVELLPVHKYKKGTKEFSDVTCAVCLCDFEEDEELRSLPECLHTFHVGCIDMWLYSHLNCPICRADATPSPSPVVVRPPPPVVDVRLSVTRSDLG